MQTEVQEKPKATKAAKSLTFYNKRYFMTKTLAEEIVSQWQSMFDALEPYIQKEIPAAFLNEDLEALFKKVRAKRLPGYNEYKAAGIDLTDQVKLNDAEKAFISEIKNPSFSYGNPHLMPRNYTKYKAGKVIIDTLDHMLDQSVLTLSGLELEVYQTYVKLIESIEAEKPNLVTEFSNNLHWFVPPHLLYNAPDWMIDNVECRVNPAGIKVHLERCY